MKQTQMYMLQKLAQANPNTEICGFLVNVDGVDTVLPVPNVHYHPKHNFAMHAELQNIYMNNMLENITGMYHSHNNGKTGPSDGDIASWPDFPEAKDWLYYIVVDGEQIWSWRREDGVSVGSRIC